MSEINFDLIFAQNAPASEIYSWDEGNYKRGWGYLGYSQPPPMELFNQTQYQNDLKSKLLYDELIRTNKLLEQRVLELEETIAKLKLDIQNEFNLKLNNGVKCPNILTVKWNYLNEETGDIDTKYVEYDGSAGKYVDLSDLFGLGGSGNFVPGAGIFDIIDNESVDAIVSSKGENSGNDGSNGKLEIIKQTEVNTIISSKGTQIGGASGSGDIQLELTTEEEINDFME